MAAKTLKQILDAHAEVVQEFKKQVKAAESPRPAGRDLVIREKQRYLARLEDRLAAARKTRAAELTRLDAEIARLEERIKLLEAEIETDKKNIGRITRSPRRRAPRGKPGRGPTVGKIKGVGKVLRARLEQQDIRSAADVAAMKPAALAEILEISKKRARTIVNEAKKVK